MMFRIMLLLVGICVASPAIAQMSFGPPSGETRPIDPPTTDSFEKKRDSFGPAPSPDVMKGSSIGDGWFLYQENAGDAVCTISKTWNNHPDVRRATGADQFTLVFESVNGRYQIRIVGRGGSYSVTPGKNYSYVFKFVYGGSKWRRWDGDTSKGLFAADANTLSIWTDDRFNEALAGANYLDIWVNGISVGRYRLNGSRNAVAYLRNCTRENN